MIPGIVASMYLLKRIAGALVSKPYPVQEQISLSAGPAIVTDASVKVTVFNRTESDTAKMQPLVTALSLTSIVKRLTVYPAETLSLQPSVTGLTLTSIVKRATSDPTTDTLKVQPTVTELILDSVVLRKTVSDTLQIAPVVTGLTLTRV